MGGMGSGRWNMTPRKRQADGSYRIIAPPAWMVEAGAGVYRWPKSGFFVRVEIGRDGEGADALLRYNLGRGVQNVGLVSTPSNLGVAVRWWWLCPTCYRRCLKLYFPPRADRLACRLCHNLSYESAQASRARYYKLFKPGPPRLPGLTATRIREAVRERIGGFLVAPYEGRPEPA